MPNIQRLVVNIKKCLNILQKISGILDTRIPLFFISAYPEFNHFFLGTTSSSRSDVVTQFVRPSICPLFSFSVFGGCGAFGSYEGVSRKFQGCFKEISRVFQGSFKDVSRKFQGCLKKFQGCFKEVSREF